MKPPCAPDCPNRRAVPNCHNGDICPAWAEYSAAVERIRDIRAKNEKARNDWYDTCTPGRKWDKEIRRRRQKHT